MVVHQNHADNIKYCIKSLSRLVNKKYNIELHNVIASLKTTADSLNITANELIQEKRLLNMNIIGELNSEIVERLKKFKWRYIAHIEGTIYKIKKASQFKNVNITVIDNDRIAFWHEDSGDHATVIKLKNILLF